MLYLPKGIAAIAVSCTLICNYAHSDIYDPQSSYLNKDLPYPDDEISLATAAEQNYFQKVVADVGYTSDADIGSLTMGEWKTKNGFYDSRNKVVSAKYFNSADLGLGRDMHCVDQAATLASDPNRGAGAMACYVSNHGKIGGNPEDGFAGLNDPNDREFATVAMEFRPSAEENKVRFFVFGSNSVGNPSNAAEEDGLLVYLNQKDAGGAPVRSLIQLDNGGQGHSQPGLCLSCHGGEISPEGVITDAHFLPFDTFSFEFATFETRQAAESKFFEMNKMVLAAEKSAYGDPTNSSDPNHQIARYLQESLGPNGLSDDYIEPSFNSTQADRELYEGTVKHYCRGCHLASSLELRPGFTKVSCNADSGMPHAEVNERNFLRHMAFNAEALGSYFGEDCEQPILLDFDNLEDLSLARWSYGNDVRFDGNGARWFDVVEVTDVGLVGNDKKKRVLTNAAGKLYSTLMLGRIFFNQAEFQNSPAGNLSGLRFSYRLDSTSEIRVRSWGFVGAEFTSRTAVISGATEGFETFDGTAAGLDLMDTITAYSFTLDKDTADSILQIDDLTFHNKPNSVSSSTLVDFEDGTAGELTLLNTDGAIANPSSSCELLRNQYGILDGFLVHNSMKFPDDGGRYSYSSNPILCSGEQIEQTFVLDNTDKESTTVYVEFDFVSEIYVSPTFLVKEQGSSEQQLSLVGLAREQGSLLTETNYTNYGHVRLELQTGAFDPAQLGLSLTVADQASAAFGFSNRGTPNMTGSVVRYAQGFAIDNLVVKYK